MKELKKLYIYRKRLILPYFMRVVKVIDILCYVMSVVFLGALIYEHGFRIAPSEVGMLHQLHDITWLIFIIDALGRIILSLRERSLHNKLFGWVVDSLLLITLLPYLFGTEFGSAALSNTMLLLSSHLLQILLLLALSLTKLSAGVIQLLTRRVNPSVILSTSFFIFIIIGTGMLLLPRATVDGISIIDALFMSTSAICVTGLSTVDLATTFTPIGSLFILILIQIGGLGVMTLTSFFAMFFMGGSSLYNQVMVSDVVSSKSLSSLFTTLLYILGFTFIIEALGAVIIFINIHNTLGMSLNEEIGFAVFHSISAFCNAGFSTLSENLGAEILMRGHNIFYLTITALIILGSIGFPILVNIYESLKYHLRKFIKSLSHTEPQHPRAHLYDVNTRIVVYTTVLLLVGSTVAIAILEWNNGFASMPILDKVVHSVFNAACPRTAGFNSVTISSFSVQTMLLLLILMVIGGAAQSTAGGIKVNVFAVVMLNLRAILYGRQEVTVFNRELSIDSIRRSNSTIVLYFLFVFAAIFALTLLEPEASLMALLFESISALSTVGSSLGLTSTLSGGGKLVIIALMFIGRVGVLTIASSLIKQRKLTKYKYPSGNIIIN